MNEEPMFERESDFYMDKKEKFKPKIISFTLKVNGETVGQKINYDMVPDQFGMNNVPFMQDFDKGVSCRMQFCVVAPDEKKNAIAVGFKDQRDAPSGGCCTIF